MGSALSTEEGDRTIKVEPEIKGRSDKSCNCNSCGHLLYPLFCQKYLISNPAMMGYAKVGGTVGSLFDCGIFFK